MREAVAGGGLVGSRKAPAPAGRAERLGLHELSPGERGADRLGLRVLAAADDHAFSQELAGERDGGQVLVFDLFLDSYPGAGPAPSGYDQGWATFRYHCAAVALTRELAWMAITGRRPPYNLYPGLKPRRLATGERRADRRHRLYTEGPEATSWMESPAAQAWLADTLTARLEDSRRGLILELGGANAMLGVRASDFAQPDEMVLARAARRGGCGPWPDELLARLMTLRSLIEGGP